jgi:pyruvate-formate lyase-activating enzyme
MVSRVVLDLVERVGATAAGTTVDVPVRPEETELVAAWCARTGNELVTVATDHAVVRRGRTTRNVEAASGQPHMARLWIYTNFDCNLACDYCCARSSPTAARRAIGVDRISRLVAEAAEAGVREVFLTGGEPFLLPDLDRVVASCVDRLPTTLLTNGMLFRGRRLEMLRRMPRDGLALQISLDSATAERHDRHRGAGSWKRALDGIGVALAEGFRVRVAATVAPTETDVYEEAAFHELLDRLAIPREDQVIRPVAQRGFAGDGVAVTVETLLPEVTVTADGVYWHPVGADHLDQLVTNDLFPLRTAIDEIQLRFAEYRTTLIGAAERFPCA